MSNAAKQALPLERALREQIGRRLLQSLKRHGVTQAEAAVTLNVTRAAVGNWVKGRNLPEVAQLYRLADKHKLSIDYILFGALYTPEVVDLARRIVDLPSPQRAGLAAIFGEAADDARVDQAFNNKRR